MAGMCANCRDELPEDRYPMVRCHGCRKRYCACEVTGCSECGWNLCISCLPELPIDLVVECHCGTWACIACAYTVWCTAPRGPFPLSPWCGRCPEY